MFGSEGAGKCSEGMAGRIIAECAAMAEKQGNFRRNEGPLFFTLVTPLMHRRKSLLL